MTKCHALQDMIKTGRRYGNDTLHVSDTVDFRVKAWILCHVQVAFVLFQVTHVYLVFIYYLNSPQPVLKYSHNVRIVKKLISTYMESK